MRDFDREQTRIARRYAYWAKLVGIDSWWTMYHEYVEYDPDGELVYARVQPQWEYRSAKFTWYLAATMSLSQEALDHKVVHEIAHCLVSGIVDPDDVKDNKEKTRQEEFATENVALAILRVHALRS